MRVCIFYFLCACAVCGCNSSVESPKTSLAESTILDAEVAPPPVATLKPVELEMHGDVRTDEYYWLRDRENPEVIAYLEAENAYTESVLADTKDLQEALFEEIKGRIKEDDTSPPYFKDGYWYYTRYIEGGAYPIYCRKKESMDAPEEIMLDVNEMAEGFGYFNVRGREVSTNQQILAFAEDTQGRRIYTIKFKNLATGEMYEEEIPETTGNVAWANDNRTLFYSKQDLETLRWDKIYKHTLGTDPSEDELVYEETESTFYTFVYKSKSDKYLIIGSTQTLSTEYQFLDADTPNGTFQVIQPRESDLEYSIDHFGDHFYIRTNLDAKNFRLMRTPVSTTTKANWEEVIPHREDVLLESIEIFRDYLVVRERKNGLIDLRIRPWDGSEEHYIQFEEPAYVAYVGTNPEFDTHLFRFEYASMTTPETTYDYDMGSREQTLIKQQEVLGDFNSENYVTERVYAEARDGVDVPISLVYKKGTAINGGAPLLLYGYGSYGNSLDANFRSSRLSLLDRGFVYAIAHIRGGEELGRAWYEGGKLLNKKNTFTDFIDCAEYLIENGYADPNRLFAQGGSAGGLLMGAVINMRPDLWRGIVAHVPWVDVVTTMLDDSIPLTTSEYDEWGNPNDETYYDYMLSYSPYDNVEAKDYPNMLVTTGLHDSQVQYWEPAKWVAKLRATKTDTNRLLLKTNMEAGHGGASGRYERYREIALDYAFVLDLAGVQEVVPSDG